MSDGEEITDGRQKELMKERNEANLKRRTRQAEVRAPEPPLPPEGKASNPKDIAAGNKVPLWLLSPVASAHWALAQFAGLLKYGSHNWRAAGVSNVVYASAAKRHIDAYLSGEDYDPVDGTHHLGNVMACCAIVLDAEAAGKLSDDRPPRVDVRAAYVWVEEQMQRLREKYAQMKPVHYTEREHGDGKR